MPTAAGLAATVIAIAITGCGLGPGRGVTDVKVHVTRDFGLTAVAYARDGRVAQDETVMRLLQRHFEIQTRYGGRFVEAISGLNGGNEGGRSYDWFYYVNGVEAERGAADRRVAKGDRIWWDYHDWETAMRIPAVVGSFPQPFLSGTEGKRLPVRIDCAPGFGPTCDEVAKRLVKAKVRRVSLGALGQQAGDEVLRLLVGPWSVVGTDRAASAIGRGAAASGVFARFEAGGRSLTLLDRRGRAVRTVGPGGGLVAATRLGSQQPTWVVTGLDAAGVAAAAGALTKDVLFNRFAVAVDHGLPIGLPVPDSLVPGAG